MMKNHIYKVHEPTCDIVHCRICEGDLLECIFCGCAECSLTIECCGKPVDDYRQNEICLHEIDYYAGWWIKPRYEGKRIDINDPKTYYRWSFN